MSIHKGHIFKFFRPFVTVDGDMSKKIQRATDLYPIIDEWEDRIRSRYDSIIKEAKDIDFEFDETGYRAIPKYLTQPHIRDKGLGYYHPIETDLTSDKVVADLSGSNLINDSI